jgi:hypothetical protein
MTTYLLTDFNEDRWKNTDWYFTEKLIERLPKVMFGELGHPEYDEVNLENAVISINDIFIKDKKIFGFVSWLKFAKSVNFRFSIRASSSKVNKTEYLQKIFAWDLIV